MLIWVSPSGVKTFRRCERLAAYIYNEGFREPDTAATLLGSRVHTVLEDHLKGETTHEDAQAWDIARPGLQHLPEPLTPGMEIEHSFKWVPPESDGTWGFRGIIDFMNISQKLAGDHKTSGTNFRYNLTPLRMLSDTQCIIYGKYVLSLTESPTIELRWVYYSTKSRASRKVSRLLSNELIDNEYQKVLLDASGLVNLRKSKALGSEVPVPNFPHSGCRQFGGCPKFNQCQALKGMTMKTTTTPSDDKAFNALLAGFKKKPSTAKVAEDNAVEAAGTLARVMKASDDPSVKPPTKAENVPPGAGAEAFMIQLNGSTVHTSTVDRSAEQKAEAEAQAPSLVNRPAVKFDPTKVETQETWAAEEERQKTSEAFKIGHEVMVCDNTTLSTAGAVEVTYEADPDRKLSDLDKLSKTNMHRNERIKELEGELSTIKLQNEAAVKLYNDQLEETEELKGGLAAARKIVADLEGAEQDRENLLTDARAIADELVKEYEGKLALAANEVNALAAQLEMAGTLLKESKASMTAQLAIAKGVSKGLGKNPMAKKMTIFVDCMPCVTWRNHSQAHEFDLGQLLAVTHQGALKLINEADGASQYHYKLAKYGGGIGHLNSQLMAQLADFQEVIDEKGLHFFAVVKSTPMLNDCLDTLQQNPHINIIEGLK